MTTMTNGIVSFSHSPDWQIIWLTIRQIDGDEWIAYRCGHEWHSLRMAVGYAYRDEKRISKAAMQAAFLQLENGEAQWRSYVDSLQPAEPVKPSPVVYYLPRWLVLALFLFGVAGFWALAMVGGVSVFSRMVGR